jgi:hypothetical protein
MNKIADLACQRRKHLKSGELDSALLRMFPNTPVHTRRFLRRPLAQFYAAAIKFLQSPRQRADDHRFLASIFDIADYSYPHDDYSDYDPDHASIDAMFWGLDRELNAALPHFPVDCPSRYSCALLHVIELLFDDTGRSQ